MDENRKGNRIGWTVTVIFHVAVIVVLMGYKLHTTLEKTDQLAVEFVSQEDIETLEELESLQKELARLQNLAEGDEAFNNSGQEIRNEIVDESGELKDDRNTDAKDLYAEHERLMKELEEMQRHRQEYDEEEDRVSLPEEGKTKEEKALPMSRTEGNATVSINISGRVPTYYTVPAYKCMGEGTVVVQIMVGENGRVTDAKILKAQSSEDDCLVRSSLTAARQMRFKAKKGSGKSPGTVTYRFVSQY